MFKSLRIFASLLHEKNQGAHQVKRGQPRTKRLQFENLERREVFAAELLSAFSLGNDIADTTVKVSFDNIGNRYATGTFSGTVDFDPNTVRTNNSDLLTSVGATDAYIAKYDTNDSLLWVRRIGNSQATTPSSIDRNTSGELIVTGSFSGSLTIATTTLTSMGGKDLFVAKFSPNDGSAVWARSSGTTQDDLPSDLAIGTGNQIVVATRTVPVGQLYNTRSIGLVQFASNGAVQWTKTMPMTVTSTSNAQILGLDVHVNGDIAISGSLNGTIDFDPSSQTRNVAGRGTAFVATYTPLGGIKWASTFQETSLYSGSSSAYDVEYDAVGNLIVGGQYKGDVDFDPGKGVLRLDQGGGFVAKLNSNGTLGWALPLKQSQTPGLSDINTFVRSIDLDSSGVIYVGGSFYNTVDFDPGISVSNRTSAGGRDIFFMSMSSNGAFRWVETAGGLGDDFADFQMDSTGIIHVAGGYTESIDIDPSQGQSLLQPASTRQRAFVARWRRV